MPLAPTLDQVRGHPQLTESPVNQRPDVNPLTARAPRNPFGPQPITPPAVPGWGGALTQPRPVGPQGPQVQYVPGLTPWSGTGPWSEAPVAPKIPRGQRFNPGAPFAPVIPRSQPFNPGAPVPGTFDPNRSLPPGFSPRRGPIGWAGKSLGVFDQQRGRVTPDSFHPDRRAGLSPTGTKLTKLAPEIDHAVLMGYIPDPRIQRTNFVGRDGRYRRFDPSRMVFLAHRIADDDIYPESKITIEARQGFHDVESEADRYAAINMSVGNGAHGMYQLRDPAFEELGMVDSKGNWIEDNKYGVKSRAEFRANPLAQEKALEDLLPIYAKNLRWEQAKVPEGGEIQVYTNGRLVPVEVTNDGLVAAAHREGAHRVAQYLDFIADGPITDWSTVPADLVRPFKAIEKRLLEFEGVVVFGE